MDIYESSGLCLCYFTSINSFRVSKCVPLGDGVDREGPGHESDAVEHLYNLKFVWDKRCLWQLFNTEREIQLKRVFFIFPLTIYILMI